MDFIRHLFVSSAPGKMKTTGTPRIEAVKPPAALPGGEVSIKGSGFGTRNHTRPHVQFGLAEGSLVLAAENLLIARVPDGAAGGAVRVRMGSIESAPFPMALGVQVADNLHPVASPAVDAEGNVYVTFSGERGQKVPVSLYKVTSSNTVKPFITEMMNPTGLAIDNNGYLFVACRNDGTVHRVSPDGRAMQWIEGMGIATGLAFDKGGSLYVGDRSGTIFKIAPDREIFVFATIEPSVSAYHLAFSPAGELFVTGPTTSSFDYVYRINPAGEVSTFFRGLGRPQGLAFDRRGNLYVAASIGGSRGIVRITPHAEAELVLSGSNIVGLALLPSHRAMITTNNALYSLDWDVEGLPLHP
jgi:sugar lactone lactonase YvrE